MKAPFHLLYNNDTTNTASVVSPWHEEGEPFREEMLVASIEEVAGSGVDAYMLSPGMGWVPWWQSEVEPDFYDWWRQRTGLAVEGWVAGYDRYVAEGGDMVQVLIDTCRRLDMAPFVSLRLNDVHLQENYNRNNQRSLVSCRFYCEHPEWHIDPDHQQKEGYYHKRGMNWAVPQVRDYKLALLRELAANYDLAGLELDFLRDNTLFSNDVGVEERVKIVTDFVGKVREALDAEPGPRRWLCLRIPLQIDAHAWTGLDARRLRDVGVDMFNLSGWYHTIQRTDIGAMRQRVPDAALYLEMTHSTGAHRHFVHSKGYGCPGNPRTSVHQFYTTARLAHDRGADGLSLFNFVYYRQSLGEDIPVMEPPFHVLPRLNDVAFLGRQHQYYMLGETAYYRQLPRQIAGSQTEEFTLEMLGRPQGDIVQADGRLRIHTAEPCSAEQFLAVSINGHELERTPDVSRFFGNPFDRMISPLDHRQAWILGGDVPIERENRLLLTAREPCQVIYIDCGIKHQQAP